MLGVPSLLAHEQPLFLNPSQGVLRKGTVCSGGWKPRPSCRTLERGQRLVLNTAPPLNLALWKPRDTASLQESVQRTLGPLLSTVRMHVSCLGGFPVETSACPLCIATLCPLCLPSGGGAHEQDSLVWGHPILGTLSSWSQASSAFLPFPMEDFSKASQAWETLVFPLSLAEVTCCVACKIRDAMRDLLASPTAVSAYLSGLLAG